MSNILTQERNKAIVIAIIMLVFGILFVALPNSSYHILVNVLGWVLVVLGAAGIIVYFATPIKAIASITFVNSMLLLLLGVLFLTVPGIYLALIGFALAFSGLQYMGAGIDAARAGAKGYWSNLINGAVQFVLGIILVIMRYTSAAEKAVMIYLGVSLIVYGVFLLCGILTLHKINNNIKNSVSNN